jgi:hypothetical protein
VVGESPLASPELALVDADLAAELRRGLRPVVDTWLRPRVSAEEASAAIEEAPQLVVADEPPLAESPDSEDFYGHDYIVEDVPVQPVVADEPPLAESRDREHFHDDDYIVEVVEQAPAPSKQTSSHYPVLPELEEEATEETDAALRRIRERLTEELPATERKLRRRFIFASGASAACAVGVLALDVQLQVAQLPGWLGF